MSTIKVAFFLAAGLMMSSAMVTASAADVSAKTMSGKPATSGMEGYSHHMHGQDSCKHKHDKMSAHGHGMMGDMGMMGGMGMMESPRAAMVRTLSLSDEQRAKINKLSDKYDVPVTPIQERNQ